VRVCFKRQLVGNCPYPLLYSSNVWHSISGICSFLPVTLMLMSVLEKNFLISRIAHHHLCVTLQLCLWYTCINCFIAVAIVVNFSFLINSAVQKCIFHDTVTTNGISLMYIMSASRVTFPCCATILVGGSTVSVTTQAAFCVSFYLGVIQH
jgi:hypothetical protein